MRLLRLPFQRPSVLSELGLCCMCGQPIRNGEDFVTVVVTPFARLRSHRDCYAPQEVEWPNRRPVG